MSPFSVLKRTLQPLSYKDDLCISKVPDPPTPGKLSHEDLQQGDIVMIKTADGREMTGCVADRPSYKHGKVVILRKSQGYYRTWRPYNAQLKITEILSILGHVPTTAFIGDSEARSLLEAFVSKSSKGSKGSKSSKSPKSHQVFKVGDRVKVVRKSTTEDLWVASMDSTVGDIAIVTKVKKSRTNVSGTCTGSWCYPNDALELVE